VTRAQTRATGDWTSASRPRGRRADVVDSAEFGELVGIGRVHTVRRLCREGLVPGATKVSHDWRIHWPTFYAALAGPGVAEGRIIGPRQLASMLHVHDRTVRRASAPPGTPDRIPGLQLGRIWLYAVPAVEAYLGLPLEDADRVLARPPAAGSPAADPQPGAPDVVFLAPPALDHPGGTTPQTPVTASPARASAAARRRRIQPAPGRSPTPR